MSGAPSVEQTIDEPPPAQNAVEAWRVSAANLRPWLRSGVGMASTGVSLTLGMLSLLFLAWPALKPEPEVAPVALGALLSNAAIERGVDLASAYERTGETAPANYSFSDLAVVGLMIGFDVVIDGFEGQTLRLRWTMHDATTLEQVPEERLVDQPGWPDGTFTAQAEQDRMNADIWVQLPARPGSYVVRMSLFDPSGTRIAMLETGPIEQS